MSLAVANRYASALVDAVLNKHVDPEAVAGQLTAVTQAVAASADLRNVLMSPAVRLDRKRHLMGRLCDLLEAHPLVRNFITVLVRHRRTNLMATIQESFVRLLDERRGVVEARIASASELSPASRAAIEGELSRVAGKHIRAEYRLDPELLGGVTARIGSVLFDGSVRGQLESLRRKMTAGA